VDPYDVNVVLSR